MKTCKTCEWFYKEHCCNGESDLCTEYVGDDDFCSKWEAVKDIDTTYKLLIMDIEELIEKYKQEQIEYLIECSKGDASRLKNELVVNKLTEVIEDLEGLC